MKDVFFSRENRYSIGVEEESGRGYLSIPVSNGVVDYEEFYALDPAQYDAFLADEAAAVAFADRCRAHEHDDLLLQQPGWNRGIPT